MKKVIFIFLAVFSTSVLQGQINGETVFRPVGVDLNLISKLKKAKAASEFKGLPIDDCFWMFSDSLEGEELIPGFDLRTFYDTLSSYMEGVCDCMIRNDTVILQGGIAYGGGIGFDVRITKETFNGSIWMAGKGFKVDSTAEFQEELLLRSVYQTLKVHDRNFIASGKTIIGEIFMESERFISMKEPTPNKLYMKILFSCKLDGHIVF